MYILKHQNYPSFMQIQNGESHSNEGERYQGTFKLSRPSSIEINGANGNNCNIPDFINYGFICIRVISIFVDFVGKGEFRIQLFNEKQIFYRFVCKLWQNNHFYLISMFTESTTIDPHVKTNESAVYIHS